MAPPFSKIALSGPGGGDFAFSLLIHNRKRFKGLPKGHGQRGIHPNRVRKYGLEQAPFSGPLPLPVFADGVLEQFQKFDRLVDVIDVGSSVPVIQDFGDSAARHFDPCCEAFLAG